MPTVESLRQLCDHLVECLNASDLTATAVAAMPWLRRSTKAVPVNTRCLLEGSPPVLSAHYSDPLKGTGLQLFSTGDPPEIACDVSLLAEAPPSMEAYLMDDGRVLQLRWNFSSNEGLLHLTCQAEVSPLDLTSLEGSSRLSAISSLLGIVLDEMRLLPDGAAFLEKDPHALEFLLACSELNAAAEIALSYALHHRERDVAANHTIINLLITQEPDALYRLLPDIEKAGLRQQTENLLLTLLEGPRSWLEPSLLERVAVFTRPEVDARVVAWLEKKACPWIAWWLMAQALESRGSVPTAVHLACQALEKLPTSMDTIQLLARCGGEEAVQAVALAVAWMTEEKYHRLDAARALLDSMVPPGESLRHIEEALVRLRSSTRLSSRIR